MHFVYICKSGNNEELRYSIRSVMKHAQNPSVSVVGGKPDWYKGHYIEVPQDMSKYRNAMNNLMAILDSPEIPEEFILMNDDFFILKDIDSIPTFNGGVLRDKVEHYADIAPKSRYTTKLRFTERKIKSMGTNIPLDYELHVPFVVEKSKLRPIIRNKNIDALWRSVYGNYYKIGGECIQDVKVYTRGPMRFNSFKVEDADIFLSSDDSSFKDLVGPILHKKFPRRCELEYTSRELSKHP